MKRVFSVLMSIVIVLSCIVFIDVEDILNKTYYMVSEKNGITLTSKND